MLYGMMLGDATIEGHGEHARMRIRHAESQKDYVLHKYGLLREVATGEPKENLWGNGSRIWGFDTSTSGEWQRIWSTFHQDVRTEIRKDRNGNPIRYHRKVLTQTILRELDAHGLAMWIMDDGCLDVHRNKARRCWTKRLVLSTDGFTEGENEKIRHWLLEKYGVQAHVVSNSYPLKDGTTRHSKRIRVGWAEYQKLIAVIEPFIIPSMRYKIEPSQDKGLPVANRKKTHSDLAGDRESRPETADRPV